MVSKVGFAVAAVAVVVNVACGGSITEPAAVPKTTLEAKAPPAGSDGQPPTQPPTPAPAPPGPGVPPGPPTTPATDYYDAELATVFWFGTPLFGKTLAIEVWPARGELWLNSTRLWILQRDAESIIASDKDPKDPGAGAHSLMATLNLKTGQWSFNGLVGNGAGTMKFRESR